MYPIFFVGISYNLPRFCPNATWNPNATTFVQTAAIGTQPVGIFVDINNTVYLGDEKNNRVLVWTRGNLTSRGNFSAGLRDPRGIFATTNGDIYVDNGNNNGRVDKWSSNATIGVTVMSVTDQCDGLFIDLNDTLYCSVGNSDEVLKKSLQSNGTSASLAAGTGSGGSAGVKPFWC